MKNGRKKEILIKPRMFSVREEQYERLIKLANAEGRSKRELFERMLNLYEKKNKATT